MRSTRKFSLILKTRLKPIVNHCLFEAFITICIIFNTVLLAMEHHGQTAELEEWLKKGNNVSAFMGFEGLFNHYLLDFPCEY